EGGFPGAGSTDDKRGVPGAPVGLNLEPAAVGADSADLDGPVHGQLVALFVVVQVLDDVTGSGERLAPLARHRPARQRAVLGLGEQSQRVPAVTPGPACTVL